MNKYRLRIPGPAGQIELAALDPGEARSGLVVIAHPHPLYGGSLDNKVVETLARSFADMGQVAVRFNFRGVGESAGVYDEGYGEVDDVLAVVEFVRRQYPADLPLTLVGFSFGAFVQSKAWWRLEADQLMLVAPAVSMFNFGAVPPGTVVIHGAEDHTIPLADVEQWAAAQNVPVHVVPGADHFFNHSLGALMQALVALCPS